MAHGYSLLDSGEGQRLEQFGDRILVRPSSLAIWKKRKPSLWGKADAVYDHDAGWRFRSDNFEGWHINVEGIELALRLQRNGQIGFFPEHTSYLPEIQSAVTRLKTVRNAAPTVLNLFAYTGMATMAAAKAGAVVTHIDLLKPALDWARQNAEANQIKPENLKLIPEEALLYLEREVKRSRKYDIIILDPPSFSRISKSKSWDLPDILAEITTHLAQILAPAGEIFFTSHGTEHGATTVENLLRDVLPQAEVVSRQLAIPEADSPRSFAAGYFVHLKDSQRS